VIHIGKAAHVLRLPPSFFVREPDLLSDDCSKLRFMVWSFLKAGLQFTPDQLNGAMSLQCSYSVADSSGRACQRQQYQIRVVEVSCASMYGANFRY
jgi:hypothetical protein